MIEKDKETMWETIWYKVFCPTYSHKRTYIQAFGVFLACLLFFFYQYSIKEDLLAKDAIKGNITDIKIGQKGGGVGKSSGRSSYYHLQLKEYKRNFLLEDASVFENWQFDENDFKSGDEISFKIKKKDLDSLNKQTIYEEMGPQRKLWPMESSSIKIYGIVVNGEERLSVGSTVRGEVYNSWFLLFIISFIYIVYMIFMTTGFRNWRGSEE